METEVLPRIMVYKVYRYQGRYQQMVYLPGIPGSSYIRMLAYHVPSFLICTQFTEVTCSYTLIISE